MAVLPLEETCIMCFREGTMRCSACKVALYCSKSELPFFLTLQIPRLIMIDCQKLDFNNHKLFCSELNVSAPFPDMRRALYFPNYNEPDRLVPTRLVWIQVKLQANKDGTLVERWVEPTDKLYFTQELDYVDRGFFRSSLQSREMVREQGFLVFEKHWCSEEDEDNGNLINFTRNGICGEPWGGPLLVMHMYKTEEGAVCYRDMDCYDIRHAADCLSTLHRGESTRPRNIRPLPGATPIQTRPKIFHASIISCPASFSKTGLDYKEIMVNAMDPVFWKEGSDIATCIELPLLIRKTRRPLDKYVEQVERSRWYNYHTVMLKRDLHSLTTAPGPGQEAYEAYKLWMSCPAEGYTGENKDLTMSMIGRVQSDGEFGCGLSPVMWSGDTLVGDVVVVRVDGKPLLWRHLEVICEYIVQEVEPRIKAAIAGLPPNSDVPNRDNVIASINKDDFLGFFHRFKEIKAQTQPAWISLNSPYDVKNGNATQQKTREDFRTQYEQGMMQWSDIREDHPEVGDCLA
jgi:hypothetical protein